MVTVTIFQMKMPFALRIYSWRGFFKEKVEAKDVKSRQHARHLGPFCSPEREQMVTWVRASWDKNRKKRSSHFRLLPKTYRHKDLRDIVKEEIEDIQNDKRRSTIHNPSRDALAETLRTRIGSSIKWVFPGGDYSDFPVAGDLMAHVEVVETEYQIKTPFGADYRFDIALLGPVIKNRRIILGAIELELEHKFESTKCLLSKCLGFPLLSLDLKTIEHEPFDGEQLLKRLVETTKNSADERRRNYFYLHPSLYPIFLQFPILLKLDKRHQYIIFAGSMRLSKIRESLDSLREKLGFTKHQVVIQPVPKKNSQQDGQFENEGSIAGHDWRDYNENEYLRVSLDRPVAGDLTNLMFHLTMARIVNSVCPALVGYKYELSHANYDRDEPIWSTSIFSTDVPVAEKFRIAPKHLSEPVDSILNAVRKIQSSSRGDESL